MDNAACSDAGSGKLSRGGGSGKSDRPKFEETSGTIAKEKSEKELSDLEQDEKILDVVCIRYSSKNLLFSCLK